MTGQAVTRYEPAGGRWGLADEARKRGIEPIELKLGDDLEVLVRGAVERGADGLAMAGGDGSQVIVCALEAFVDGGERRVDLAEVNGRVFVNNVSLGLYAKAVQSAGYRNAKIRTLPDTVPDVLGPSGTELDMRWSGPGGHGSFACGSPASTQEPSPSANVPETAWGGVVEMTRIAFGRHRPTTST